MSSALRSHRQIGAREKFLITLADTKLYPLITTSSADGTSVIRADDAALTVVNTGTVDVSSGVLLRDMGREVNVYAAANSTTPALRTAVLREVQQVSGNTSEGVPSDKKTYLVCVWSDVTPDTTPVDSVTLAALKVTVARTG